MKLTDVVATITETLENATCGLEDTAEMFSFDKAPLSTIHDKYRVELASEAAEEMTSGYIVQSGEIDIYIAKKVAANMVSKNILTTLASFAETVETELYKAFPGTVFFVTRKEFQAGDMAYIILMTCQVEYERSIA